MKDYKIILDFYDISYSGKSNYLIKKSAEEILAKKLCRCIKKLDKKEDRPVSICNKSIFTNRNLKYNRFTCKKRPKLIGNKKTRRKLTKRGKSLTFKKRRN